MEISPCRISTEIPAFMSFKILRPVVITVLLLSSFAFVTSSVFTNAPLSHHKISTHREAKPVISRHKIADVKVFVKNNNYNQQFCFIIDMALPSGSNRFFVYDLQKDTITHAGLVTHGNCMQYWLEGRKYSNDIGCGCTSLGKYKVGKSYFGKFGLAYKLYGLDSSNSNTFKRFVVLHSHACVPVQEQKGDICQSNGCPTVSPGFLKKLQKIIDNTGKPILLFIYG